MLEKMYGIMLALASGVFIGSSFICTKYSLMNEGGLKNLRCLRSKLWWLGLCLMGVGEIANFAAYSFSSALVVTPFGCVSVVVGAVLAVVVLKEECSRHMILGIVLCIAGTVSVVVHAPEERAFTTVDEILHLVLRPYFLAYITFSIGLSLALSHRVDEQYKGTNVLIYISICSLIGSLAVVACKALGTAVLLTLTGSNQMDRVFPYFCAFVCMVCIPVTLKYFNKALDAFDTSVVTPVYYVMFTVCTVCASTLLFESYRDWDAHACLSMLCAFFPLFIGVVLLKEGDGNRDVPDCKRCMYYRDDAKSDCGELFDTYERFVSVEL